MRMLLTVVMACLIPATASGQVAAQRQHRHRQIVSQVHVLGNRRVPESTIISNIGTREGDKYDAAQIDRDVRALFATGHFLDIKAFSEDGYPDGEGKVVTFEVDEWPLISDIKYEGIDPDIVAMVPEEWAKLGIKMAKGSEYSPVRVKRAAKVIEGLLVSNGSPSTVVECVIENISKGEVVVSFTASQTRVIYRSRG